MVAGLLCLGAVRRQQSDLLHDSWTELTVQLVTTGPATLGSTGGVCLHYSGFVWWCLFICEKSFQPAYHHHVAEIKTQFVSCCVQIYLEAQLMVWFSWFCGVSSWTPDHWSTSGLNILFLLSAVSVGDHSGPFTLFHIQLISAGSLWPLLFSL